MPRCVIRVLPRTLPPAVLLLLLASPLAPATASSSAPAEVVRHTRTDACDQFFVRPPADAETLRSEAFEWTQQTPLRDWQFAPITLADSGMRDNEWYDELLEATCARVSYSSAMRMPSVVQKYMSLGNFCTKIVKMTCVQADSFVLNDIRLAKIPFICRVHITSQMRFANGQVVTHMCAEYVLPWYLRFLESTAEGVVTHSLNDEIRATVHQLCVAPGQAPSHALPPFVVAQLLPPVAYFSR